MAKVEATRNYGARVEMRGARFEDALDAARAHVEETGALFVHPYEDPVVIAGQGTLGLELADQLPDVSTVVVPIGGGGLCSGIALALKAVRPRWRSSASRPRAACRAEAASRSPTGSPSRLPASSRCRSWTGC